MVDAEICTNLIAKAEKLARLYSRPVYLTFKAMSGNADLMQAIKFTQSILQKGKSLAKVAAGKIPCEFIPKGLGKYFYKEGDLQIKRYEFLMLQTIRNKVESGDIYIPDSFAFKSFDEDLIPLEYWNNNQEAIIDSIDVPKLKQPVGDLLKELIIKLEQKFKKVNESILRGENMYGPQAYWAAE